MFDSTRRNFLQQTGIGLATVGISGLVLRSDAQPTQEVSRDQSDRILIQMGPMQKEGLTAKADLRKVTPQPFGPFYRIGAPFRGKLSLPGEPGTTFVLSGRVWAYDTKRPLPGVVLDFWHVDMEEKYSNGTTDFRNRGRLVSSETVTTNWRAFALFLIDPIRRELRSFGAAHTFIWWRPAQDISRWSQRFISRAIQKRMTRCIVLRMRFSWRN